MIDLAVIIQCRISSTRLPGKATKDLGGKTVFEWVMNSMKKVPAQKYIVATDYDSFDSLEPLAKKCNWEIIAGPLEDVLERYCMAIRKADCRTVLRATCDNPFLFYEAAISLVEEYNHQKSIGPVDYMTWTGLPHGCGVEVFDAFSLLKAASLTTDPYDREHVGPALYNHKEKFTSLFYRSPERFFHPDYRTTIDTPSDYRRAISIVSKLSGGIAPEEPYTTEQIVSAVKDPLVHDTVLFFPIVKKGYGTGHLRRCLSAAMESNSFIYIPSDTDLEECNALVAEYIEAGLKDYQVVHKFPEPNEYALIATDCFVAEKELLKKLSELATLVSIDEGSSATEYCDYLLDIIPSYNIERKPNLFETDFIEKPIRRKTPVKGKYEKALIVFGGEDPSELTVPASKYFSELCSSVTAISSKVDNLSQISNVKYVSGIKNLKEKLWEYDLVVTHYGLTAFEAVCAGCAVILVSTTKLHENLAKKYGFLCLSKHDIEQKPSKEIFSEEQKLYPSFFNKENTQNLGSFIRELSHGKKLICPVCQTKTQDFDTVVSRIKERTFRRCANCGIVYISWNLDSEKKYEKDYFADSYKKQYGKTYLEDFDSIKKAGLRRMLEINGSAKLKGSSSPTILDVGCAYGPFLMAAAESGWRPYGTDISKDAIEYVRSKLLFPAVQSKFPQFDPAREFGINRFDAITMWYVIEHFQDLKSVLQTVSQMLKEGGVFAFSTPSGSGVSAKLNTEEFFKMSPSDHYTIWEPSKADKILSRFGFKVVKIVSTGHHPERFPKIKNNGIKKDDSRFKLYNQISKIKKLGDTFEVYCRKI